MVSEDDGTTTESRHSQSSDWTGPDGSRGLVAINDAGPHRAAQGPRAVFDTESCASAVTRSRRRAHEDGHAPNRMTRCLKRCDRSQACVTFKVRCSTKAGGR